MPRGTALVTAALAAAAFLAAAVGSNDAAKSAAPAISDLAATAPHVASDAGTPRPALVPQSAGRRATAARLPDTLFLGDSVMLGARPWLRELPGRVDAVEGRQVYAGLSIVQRLARTGRLPGTVVVGLGTNGQFPGYACRDLHQSLGSTRRLLLVTIRVPRSWTAADNRVIQTCAQRYPNVWLVPWRAFSGHHLGVFAADGYHLSARGSRMYARLVRTQLVRTRLIRIRS
jgi:hypothetical protein